MRKFILFLLAGIFMVTLIGCETAKGVGKDVENTGQNIQQGIDRIGK